MLPPKQWKPFGAIRSMITHAQIPDHGMSRVGVTTGYSINSTSDAHWATHRHQTDVLSAAVTQLHPNTTKPVYYTHGSTEHKHSLSEVKNMRNNSGGVEENYNISQTLNYCVHQSSWHFWNILLDNENRNTSQYCYNRRRGYHTYIQGV